MGTVATRDLAPWTVTPGPASRSNREWKGSKTPRPRNDLDSTQRVEK